MTRSNPPSNPENKKSPPFKEADLDQITHQLFMAFDQKLETLRRKNDQIQTLQHERDLRSEGLENTLNQKIHDYHLQMKALESSLQYLSHKTELKLKEMDNSVDKAHRKTEAQLKDIHFQCREDVSALSRRIEVIEQLLL